MLGLANYDAGQIQDRLRSRFSQVHPLVGRDLASYIYEQDTQSIADQPVYFMTDDDVTRGQHQINPLGVPYPSVLQPNHVETVIATLPHNGTKERWKLSRYFDNTQFWSQPGIRDVAMQPIWDPACGHYVSWAPHIKTQPEQDEYELYNMTDDPMETCNLAHPSHATLGTRDILARMMQLLDEQRKQKRVYPSR